MPETHKMENVGGWIATDGHEAGEGFDPVIPKPIHGHRHDMENVGGWIATDGHEATEGNFVPVIPEPIHGHRQGECLTLKTKIPVDKGLVLPDMSSLCAETHKIAEVGIAGGLGIQSAYGHATDTMLGTITGFGEAYSNNLLGIMKCLLKNMPKKVDLDIDLCACKKEEEDEDKGEEIFALAQKLALFLGLVSQITSVLGKDESGQDTLSRLSTTVPEISNWDGTYVPSSAAKTLYGQILEALEQLKLCADAVETFFKGQNIECPVLDQLNTYILLFKRFDIEKSTNIEILEFVENALNGGLQISGIPLVLFACLEPEKAAQKTAEKTI